MMAKEFSVSTKRLYKEKTFYWQSIGAMVVCCFTMKGKLETLTTTNALVEEVFNTSVLGELS